jgi:tetratricopeptide (TPR) repeat protein
MTTCPSQPTWLHKTSVYQHGDDLRSKTLAAFQQCDSGLHGGHLTGVLSKYAVAHVLSSLETEEKGDVPPGLLLMLDNFVDLCTGGFEYVRFVDWLYDPAGEEPPLAIKIDACEPLGSTHGTKVSETCESLCFSATGISGPELEVSQLTMLTSMGSPFDVPGIDSSVAPCGSVAFASVPASIFADLGYEKLEEALLVRHQRPDVLMGTLDGTTTEIDTILDEIGRTGDATQRYADTLALLRERCHDASPQYVAMQVSIGKALARQGHFAQGFAIVCEAAAVARTVWGDTSREFGGVQRHLGVLLLEDGSFSEALDSFELAGVALERSCGEGSVVFQELQMDRARTCIALGKLDFALTLLHRALEVFTVLVASECLGRAAVMIADLFGRKGLYSEALDTLRQCDAHLGGVAAESSGACEPLLHALGSVLHSQASAQWRQGDVDGSLDTMKRLADIRRRAPAGANAPKANAMVLPVQAAELGSTLYVQGRLDDALALMRWFSELHGCSVAQLVPEDTMMLYDLGKRLWEQGSSADALEVFQRSLKLQGLGLGLTAGSAIVLRSVAEILEEQGHLKEALCALQCASEVYRSASVEDECKVLSLGIERINKQLT